MRILLTVAFMSTLTFLFQPEAYSSNTAPFVSLSSHLHTTKPGMITSFTCRMQEDRVLLNWMVKENETADRVIVQRSRNGKKFEMVGLVFASEKADIEKYIFSEKLTSRKSVYRLIIVRKDQNVEYSEVIRINQGK